MGRNGKNAIICRFRSNVISADGRRCNLAAKPLSHALQTPESNMNYLTRMSQRVGAVAKPSDGHLIFANDMSGKSVSGKNLPTKYVDVSEIGEYTCSFKETESGRAIGTVFANWRDKNAGEYRMVSAGSGDPEYELDEIFSSEKAALAAANAKFKRVAKSNKTLSFTTSGRVVRPRRKYRNPAGQQADTKSSAIYRSFGDGRRNCRARHARRHKQRRQHRPPRRSKIRSRRILQTHNKHQSIPADFHKRLVAKSL
jgi:phage protein D